MSDPGTSSGSQGAIDSRELIGLSPSSTSISAIRKRFKSFSFYRRKTVDVGEGAWDAWGPFGLHLLHSPPNPLIDFIFIHGLRGGSVKTWCKDNDVRLYWPQSWLPRDSELQNVRIHSFGYNSDWGDTKDTTSLDLHDFGRSLFGEMFTSPELKKGKQVF
jgi:hypothetical protein